MDFRAWAPEYRRIRQEFGFSEEEDERAVEVLRELLRHHPGALSREEAVRLLDHLVRGRRVWVVGPAGQPMPFRGPLFRRPPDVVVAADGATTVCLRHGLIPDIIVTDLDGIIPDEIRACEGGAVVVVQAHGQNMSALRRWLPRFPGRIIGSGPTEPVPPILNAGGFTDGDRAVYLAQAFQAQEVVLVGFDFETAVAKGSGSPRLKQKKLFWARELLRTLAKQTPLRILSYDARGLYDWLAAPPVEDR
jgi:uncharacterized Rossmann fold enzyme